MTALLALSAALTFGASDFAGGLAARRAPALTVSWFAQAAGLLVLAPALLLLPGVLSSSALAAGAVGGVAGACGLVLYLRGLAIGPMGLASPLAGVAGAVLPVAIGFGTGERPTTLATVGIALGLAAVVLVGGRDLAAGARRGASSRSPLLALLGGVGFGVFFVALDASPADSGLWSLVGARAASLVLLGAALAVRRVGVPRDGRFLALALATGTLDMVANVLFLGAARAGMLSLAALITSLYPVVVAGLAHSLLRERLDRVQWGAVVACLGAVGLIALS
ncbi:MAG: EamA family transporter [Nitriliruptor sp.]|uniref:EamA family transporter n=1 Tax=Nitriliruptor sp. TaxID=2448056 RepID=UPI0034A002E5